jgi:hypothetical protein
MLPMTLGTIRLTIGGNKYVGVLDTACVHAYKGQVGKRLTSLALIAFKSVQI